MIENLKKVYVSVFHKHRNILQETKRTIIIDWCATLDGLIFCVIPILHCYGLSTKYIHAVTAIQLYLLKADKM